MPLLFLKPHKTRYDGTDSKNAAPEPRLHAAAGKQSQSKAHGAEAPNLIPSAHKKHPLHDSMQRV